MSQPAPSIRKNDNVIVITGRDRGDKVRRVLGVIPDKGRVIVEGVNIIKRHTKANPQKNVKGGIVEREASVNVSNVQIVCPECSQRTRIGKRLLEDGRRVRVCVKCKGVMDK